jgi:hypothetical protein
VSWPKAAAEMKISGQSMQTRISPPGKRVPASFSANHWEAK